MRTEQPGTAIVYGTYRSFSNYGRPHQPVYVFHRLDLGLNNAHPSSIISASAKNRNLLVRYFNECRKYIGQFLPAAMLEHVSNGVLVQSGQKRVQSLIQHALEPAYRSNGTRIRLLFKTLNQAEAWFRAADHVPQSNQMRLARQSYASRTARMDLNIPIVRKRLNHPDQVILRNPVRIADLLSRHSPVRMSTQIYENAKGVIGV
jgi:hypothetical protein